MRLVQILSAAGVASLLPIASDTRDLDIAGVAWSSKGNETTPKGATAFGVRLLDRLIADNYER